MHRLEIKNIELNELEKTINAEQIDLYLSQAMSLLPDLETDPNCIRDTKKMLEDFVTQEKITLNNLVEGFIERGKEYLREKTEFLAIIQSMLKSKSKNEVLSHRSQLSLWKNDLYHSKNRLMALHRAQSSGMVSDLLETGEISLNSLGTDLDGQLCLKEIAISPRDIRVAGDVVLPPSSINDPYTREDIFRSQLCEAKQAIKNKQVTGHINLISQINCGNAHYVTSIVVLQSTNNANDIKIKDAIFWDPLSGNADAAKAAEQTANFRAYRKALDVFEGNKSRYVFGNVQRNGVDCLFHSLQKIYQMVVPEHPIAKAATGAPLRLEVAKQTIKTHPALGEEVANKLSISNNKIKISPRNVAKSAPSAVREKAVAALPDDTIEMKPTRKKTTPVLMTKELTAASVPASSKIENVLKKAVDKTALALTIDERKDQIQFDEMFAKHLHNQFVRNPRVNDTIALKTAYKSARRDFNLFYHDDSVDESTEACGSKFKKRS